MIEQKTIGFIGYGNMAQAIAQGWVKAGVLKGENIVACAAHYDKLVANAAQLGVRPLHTPEEVVQASDVVIIAIKPYQIEKVLAPLAEELAQPRIFVISLAAGWNLEQYQDLLGEDVAVQCTIPNTPIAVGQGIVIAEQDHSLNDDQVAVFESLFSPIAQIERVDSKHMGITMSIAGCAPAFTAMYMEALGDAGVKYGLQRDVAYRLAAKVVEGVGALYMATGTHPGAMKDAVSSPGGATIKGVAELEQKAFRGAVIAAIDAIEGK